MKNQFFFFHFKNKMVFITKHLLLINILGIFTVKERNYCVRFLENLNNTNWKREKYKPNKVLKWNLKKKKRI